MSAKSNNLLQELIIELREIKVLLQQMVDQGGVVNGTIVARILKEMKKTDAIRTKKSNQAVRGRRS